MMSLPYSVVADGDLSHRDGVGRQAAAGYLVGLIRVDHAAGGGGQRTRNISTDRRVADVDRCARVGGLEADAVVVDRSAAIDHHIDCAGAELRGRDAIGTVAGRDAIAHGRSDCAGGTAVRENDALAPVIFHADAVEHGLGEAAPGRLDEDADGNGVRDHRIRDVELAGSGRRRQDNSLKCSADDAVLHMQRRAGEEVYAVIAPGLDWRSKNAGRACTCGNVNEIDPSIQRRHERDDRNASSDGHRLRVG